MKWIQKRESTTVCAERNDNDHECKTPISIPSAGVTIACQIAGLQFAVLVASMLDPNQERRSLVNLCRFEARRGTVEHAPAMVHPSLSQILSLLLRGSHFVASKPELPSLYAV